MRRFAPALLLLASTPFFVLVLTVMSYHDW